MNINTKAYWDARFSSGDWGAKGGFEQTTGFARAQVKLLGLPTSFTGSLCDFGCGAGDAFPIWRRAYPRAKLIGVDFSEAAIRLARARFGDIAEFECGMVDDVPPVDVIVASNVLEHLVEQEAVVRALLAKCNALHIVVPYREHLQPGSEHVCAYDETSFARFRPSQIKTFAVPGWSQYRWNLWKNVYLKNLLRPVMGRRTLRRSLQVMYTFTSCPGTRELVRCSNT